MFRLFHMDQVPWDSGDTKLWDFLLAYLVVGAFVNAIQLGLHIAIPELAKQPVGPIIIWLAIEDFLFDFICTIQCSLNRHHHEFYGHETGCKIQAFYGSFLMLMSCATIVSLMYASYLAIVWNKRPTMRQITKLHLSLALYCAIITILGNFWPGEHHLVPSGIYCYANLGTLKTALFFHILFFLPAFSALFYFYIRIYQTIRSMNAYLISKAIYNVGARPAQMRLLKLMSIYILGVALCFSLLEAGGVYGWITNANGPGGLFFAGGFMGHFLTFISPFLYYGVSARAREIVLARLGWECCGAKAQRRRDIRKQLRVPQRPSSMSQNTKDQRKHLSFLLQDEASQQKLLEFAQQHFAAENVMFWRDVQKWKVAVTRWLELHSASVPEFRGSESSASSASADTRASTVLLSNRESLSPSALASGEQSLVTTPVSGIRSLQSPPGVATESQDSVHRSLIMRRPSGSMEARMEHGSRSGVLIELPMITVEVAVEAPVEKKTLPKLPHEKEDRQAAIAAVSLTEKKVWPESPHEEVKSIAQPSLMVSGDSDQAELRHMATDIYRMYIAVTAPLQVNLPFQVSGSIIQRLHLRTGSGSGIEALESTLCIVPETAHLFDEAESEIFELILGDIYPRYVLTTEEKGNPQEQDLAEEEDPAKDSLSSRSPRSPSPVPDEPHGGASQTNLGNSGIDLLEPSVRTVAVAVADGNMFHVDAEEWPVA